MTKEIVGFEEMEEEYAFDHYFNQIIKVLNNPKNVGQVLLGEYSSIDEFFI